MYNQNTQYLVQQTVKQTVYLYMANFKSILDYQTILANWRKYFLKHDKILYMYQINRKYHYNNIYVLFAFSGLAGVIYFLLDVQQPHLAKFPTYNI